MLKAVLIYQQVWLKEQVVKMTLARRKKEGKKKKKNGKFL